MGPLRTGLRPAPALHSQGPPAQELGSNLLRLVGSEEFLGLFHPISVLRALAGSHGLEPSPAPRRGVTFPLLSLAKLVQQRKQERGAGCQQGRPRAAPVWLVVVCVCVHPSTHAHVGVTYPQRRGAGVWVTAPLPALTFLLHICPSLSPSLRSLIPAGTSLPRDPEGGGRTECASFPARW